MAGEEGARKIDQGGSGKGTTVEIRLKASIKLVTAFPRLGCYQASIKRWEALRGALSGFS